MDDEPIRCPTCGRMTLLPIRAAEVPGPLLYGCGECSAVLSPEDAVSPEPSLPEKPKGLLDRIKEAIGAG